MFVLHHLHFAIRVCPPNASFLGGLQDLLKVSDLSSSLLFLMPLVWKRKPFCVLRLFTPHVDLHVENVKVIHDYLGITFIFETNNMNKIHTYRFSIANFFLSSKRKLAIYYITWHARGHNSLFPSFLLIESFLTVCCRIFHWDVICELPSANIQNNLTCRLVDIMGIRKKMFSLLLFCRPDGGQFTPKNIYDSPPPSPLSLYSSSIV